MADRQGDDSPMTDAPQTAGKMDVEATLDERADQPSQLGTIQHARRHHHPAGVV